MKDLVPADLVIAGIIVPILVYAIIKLWQAYQRMTQDRIKDLKHKGDNDA